MKHEIFDNFFSPFLFTYYSQLSKLFGIDFLQYRLWIGIWVMLICWAVVAFEGCFLVEYFTRFTEEVFSVLISMLFVYEAVYFLMKVCILLKSLMFFKNGLLPLRQYTHTYNSLYQHLFTFSISKDVQRKPVTRLRKVK